MSVSKEIVWGAVITIFVGGYFLYNKWREIKTFELIIYWIGMTILVTIIFSYIIDGSEYDTLMTGSFFLLIFGTFFIISLYKKNIINSFNKIWFYQNIILILWFVIILFITISEYNKILPESIFLLLIFICTNSVICWILSKKKGKRKVPIIVSIGVFLIIIICTFVYLTIAENNAWKTAKNIDTEKSYKEYLSKYPNAKNSEIATNSATLKWLEHTFSKNVLDSVNTNIFSFDEEEYCFSETFINNENNWHEYDNDEKYFQVINGKANMQQLEEGYSFWNWKDVDGWGIENFIIKFETDVDSMTHESGICFKGKETRYANFILITNFFYSCGYYDEDKTGKKLVRGDIHVTPAGTENHILLEAIVTGDSAQFFINSNYVADLKGFSNSGIDDIGFVLGGAGPIVEFDNLFIYKLDKK